MAGTVTANLTDISMCESTTGWTNVGSGTPGINDPTVFDAREGTYCLQDSRASIGNRGSRWDFGAGTPVDFSDKVVIFWLAFSKKNYGSNPMRFRMTDTDGDYAEWNMFSQGDLPHGGWIPWILKPTVTKDLESGTFNIASVRYVDWRCDSVAAKVLIYWDAVRYGYGLDIKGGTSGDPAKMDDFVSVEATYAYGIVEKYQDVYFLQGQIRIGSLTVDESTYFKETNKVIQFKAVKGTPSGFYEIKGQRATSGSGTTKIFFGEKAGTAGISGCFISAPSAMRWKLTVTDTNITEFGFYGCRLVYADTIQGQAYSTLKEFLASDFVASYEVQPDTGIVKLCKFISSPSGQAAIRITGASHHIENCDFISCTRGFNATSTATLSFVAMKFSGCAYDGYNSSGSPITVNYDSSSSSSNGWNYDPAGSTITYQSSVTLTIRGIKSGNEPTNYVRCAIYKKSDMTEIMNKDADVTDDLNPGYYKASQSYTATGIVVICRAREKGWLPFQIEVTIPAAGLDLQATWLADPNYTP